MIDLKALLEQYSRLDRREICRKELGDNEERIEACVRAAEKALKAIKQLSRLSIEEVAEGLARSIAEVGSDSGHDYEFVTLFDLKIAVDPLIDAVRLANEAPQALMSAIYGWVEELLRRLDAEMAALGFKAILPLVYKDGAYVQKSVADVMKEDDEDYMLRIYL
jgi:hypothetical protein